MVSDSKFYHNLKTNADLMFNANFNLSELNDMMPFEREAYIKFWNEHIEELEKKNGNT